MDVTQTEAEAITRRLAREEGICCGVSAGGAAAAALRLSQEVEVRNPEDLTPIPEWKTPSEILPLTRAINHLLAKLGIALYQERLFTDLAAHELKTPLAVIKTLTQSAQRAPDKAALDPILADLNAATDRATAMMLQLLALARLDHAKLSEGDIPVGDICRQAAQELAPLAMGKGLRMEVADLPNLVVKGHAETLLLGLRNLLDNAIKYSPAGGELRLSAGMVDDEVYICVADEGPGIPPDKLAHVAERFYRVAGNREVGSGLGLTIASRVAELLGGRLTLENRAGGGLLATYRLKPGSKI
jgi:signal transduction histidine kinase